MDNNRTLAAGELPKSFRWFLILLPALGYFFISAMPDNDFFFLYPTGEYILQNGFPVKDFLSMHGDMSIVVQQWLADVIFYLIYSRLGVYGLFALLCLCYTAYMVLIYKLCMRICNNFWATVLCAFIADIIIVAVYMTSRPHVFSLLLFVLELYALESYVQHKKLIYLALLPLISLLLINLHASMWLMLFVLALPYAAEAIPLRWEKLRQVPCCSLAALLITGIICFAVGFINPYGIKAMTYIFTSFGYQEINRSIYEMNPPSLKTGIGIMLFLLLGGIAATVIIRRRSNYTTRFVLLFCGTALLALMNAKSISLFVTAALPSFSYYLKDLEPKLKVQQQKKKSPKERLRIGILAVLLVAVAGGGVYTVFTPATAPEEKSEYEELNEAIAILDRAEEPVVLFTGFNYGQYLEFNGYHPYIDGRAELFLKDNNGEYDYLKEYLAVSCGEMYYRDFTDRYGFNYLIVCDSEPALCNGLSHDERYRSVYEGKKITLFRSVRP